jgi:hypothetical protein
MKKTTSIIQGNAYKDRTTHHWLVGVFIDKSKGLRKDARVEIRWSSHKAGEKKGRWTKSLGATTMTILIKGKFVNFFKNKKKCILEKEGDYIIYAPKTPHTWEAIKDSVILTVRWPSKPNLIKEVVEKEF